MHTSIVQYNKISSQQLLSYRIREKVIKTILLLNTIMVFAFNDQKNILYIVKASLLIIFSILCITRPIKNAWILLWGIAIVLWSASSLFWIVHVDRFIYNLAWTFQAIFIFSLTIYIIDNEDLLNFYIKSIVISSSVLFFRLVLFYPISIWGTSRLGASIGYNPNVIGVEAAFAAILSLYLLEKAKRKIIYVVLFLVFLMVVVFSGSRKALLGLILGLFIIVFLRSKISIYRKTFGLIFLIVFIHVFYLIMTSFEPIYNVMGKRLEVLFNVFLGTESSVRTSMIDIGLSLFGEKPWIGHGQGQYSYISGFQTYSHNNYIEFLVNFGIIGFCLYYSVYLISFYRLIKIAKSYRNGIYFFSMLIVILFLETGSVTYQSLYLLIPLSVVVIRSKPHHGNVHSIK